MLEAVSNPNQDKPVTAPAPFDMTFEAFEQEYEDVMAQVAAKEKKGRLDPSQPDYEPVSEAEQEVLARDWKEFSRARGFDETDIAEYDRWRTLSGQTDDLPGAINDPWRRSEYPGGWAARLYQLHIEKNLEQGTELKPEARASYEALKKHLEELRAESALPWA